MANTSAVCCTYCGGTTKFDPTVGKLKCEFCDAVFSQEEAEAFFKEKEKRESEKESGGDWGNDSESMKALRCSTCGAELIADSNTAATLCPYCGNSTMVEGQFSGSVKPDLIIPFAFTKKQAEEKYHEYYQKRRLIPRAFIEGNTIQEIQGVYVPFWLYDGTVSIDAEYTACDKTETQTETIKKLFTVRRRGNIAFKNVPADASKRMPDDIMDSVEPYKFSELKPFSKTYLPGFLAEKFDVEGDDDLERAEKRVKETAKQKTRETVKHDSIENSRENFTVNYTEKKYALLPIWYLTTKWNGQQYDFAMNGQTGAFTGDLPVDKGRLSLRVILAAVAAAVLVYLLSKQVLVTVIFAAIIAGIVYAASMGSMKPVHKATQATDYMDKEVKLTLQNEDFLRTERKAKPQQRTSADPPPNRK